MKNKKPINDYSLIDGFVINHDVLQTIYKDGKVMDKFLDVFRSF